MEELIRKDGFIDLDELLKSSQSKLIDWENNEEMYEEYKGTNIKYVFLYKGEQWLYKSFIASYFCYAEVISEELAKCFSIPVAHYDLATSKEFGEGVITKNFKNDKAKYISGYDILANYLKNIVSVSGIYDLENKMEIYNSLEGIWNALEYHYLNYPNREEIVKNLMEQIINIFVFDIFTGNIDRHELNWGVMEENNNISVQPLYDNERLLILEGDISLLPHLDSDINEIFEYSEKIKTMVLEFITISERKYLELFKEKLPLIFKENIEKVFSKVEERIKYSIPSDIKENIFTKFQIIEEIVNKTILEYEEERRR